MTHYVALLRGIAPTNPNMRNDKLRGVFESLGFSKVSTVISSGNVLFETESTDVPALETKIERALLDQLGLTGTTTIIRTRQQLQQLVDLDPFSGAEHSPKIYLSVTFLKSKPRVNLTFPYQPPGRDYTLLSMHDRAICSIIDITAAKTPDLMTWLEKTYGKDITTRTYKTVGRILKKMSA